MTVELDRAAPVTPVLATMSRCCRPAQEGADLDFSLAALDVLVLSTPADSPPAWLRAGPVSVVA